MRKIFILFVILLVATPVLVGIGLVMAVDDRALITVAEQPTAADVARAKQLFARYDPRKLKAGAVKNVEVGSRDLNLLANHVISLLSPGAALVEVHSGQLSARASVELPRNPLGRYLNIEADLRIDNRLPVFQKLRVGSISVPGWLANFATLRALDSYFQGQGTGLVSEFISAVDFTPGVLQVAYRWSADAVDRVREHFVSPLLGERLQVFHERLASLVGTYRSASKVPLLKVLKPMFALAQQRSEDGDATAENRAAILILSSYVNGRSVKSIVPSATQWSRVESITLTLGGRKDFAQHYLTSAALAALASGALSNAVGLFKEVDDSQGGSGFSFNDLAADRAGTRFGELAVASGTGPQTVQLRISQARSEADIMPDVGDLAEHMSEALFQRRYGSTESAAYREVMQDIEQRIAKTRLFR
jgi:hypothetical protein